MKQIIAPTHCPSCNSALETVNSVLYCRNDQCPARGTKLIENFGKVLKITGLGPATIEKLGISDIAELYSLSESDITDAIGNALGTKLYANIVNSKKASLSQVLPALGIPLIGKTATDKICANIEHLSDLTKELAQRVLGPKAAANLLEYIEKGDWVDLPFSFETEKTTITGDTVCITGKLKSFKTKAEATAALTSRGYKVVDSVTKTTKYVVNESGIESEKTKKARAQGTIIVNDIGNLIHDNSTQVG